uniref:Serine/threonine-protein phosphatase 4 regulatory subunit 2 n=1 Tax=Anopheles christyi TaxID=43041 RepID=A0A182JZ72_9DIPT
MTMENQEEILLLLERFTKSKQKDIPRELEDYLNFVARTGDTLYRWVLVKPLFREKLVNVITDFHHNTPSIADLPQCPNVDPFNFERMKRALLERLDSFNSAPFTVQRICELLTEPRKQYTRIDKFMRAVEKNILVVSTQEPGRRRSDSENGDSLDSIVNGDLEVNVDIEMDNEQFHLEADALLPDSSDSVSSIHSSLTDVGSAQRTSEGNEMNGGGRVVGAFMNSDGGASQTTKALASEAHQGVIDTNENATDGDIAAPLMEASLDTTSPSSTTKVVPERTEKSDEIETAPLHESTPTEDKDKNSTDAPVQTVREEVITTAQDDGIVEALHKQRDDAQEKVEEVGSVDEEKVEDRKSLPKPAASGENEIEQTTANRDEGEPQAKMVKYDDDSALVQSNVCTSVIKADVHASGGDDAPVKQTKDTTAHIDENVAEASSTTNTVDDTVASVTEQNAATIETSSAASTVVLAGDGETVVGGTPLDSTQTGEAKENQVHSTDETLIAEEAAAGKTTNKTQPLADAETTDTSTEVVTSTNASEMEAASVDLTAISPVATGSSAASTSEELEMELATVATASAGPPPSEVAVEEVDMAGETGATEMTDEDPKQDDNVMDIDESSVEMMDQ